MLFFLFCPTIPCHGACSFPKGMEGKLFSKPAEGMTWLLMSICMDLIPYNPILMPLQIHWKRHAKEDLSTLANHMANGQ